MDLFVLSLTFYQLTISSANIFSQDSPLHHFAVFNNVMFSTTNHTIGSPGHLPLNACAELCLNNSYHVTIKRQSHHVADFREEFHNDKQRSVSPLKNDYGDTCKAFEYITSTGFCILLKKAAATDNQGYNALKKAPGATYFELSKSLQDLFMTKNHMVFDGQDKYNKVIYNVSADRCAKVCVTAPDLSCNSFVFSTSLHVCALSNSLVNEHIQLKTTNYYDFFQYSGVWPCNATLPWQYKPRVIASQMYPYAHDGNSTCHFKIIAPPGMKIVIRVQSFFTNTKTNSGNDGLYIFDGEEHAEDIIDSFCQKSDNWRHSSLTSSNRSITVKIVQEQNIVITRVVYEFLPISCASSPCLFSGKCVETVQSFECICPNGTSGKRCDMFVGDCYSNPCISGTCHPVGGTSGYQCHCFEGFTGANCEYNINECFSSPCINGRCEDLINNYICVCNDSFTGRHCQINRSLAACSRHDCQFGACAINESGSYCQCFPGFTGISCDTDIDDCNDSPCSHGTCVDHVNAYSCNCSSGYAGTKCDILLTDPCRDNPCYHGYCSVKEKGFTCICENGYTGSRCEHKTSLCFSECRHGKCFNVFNSQYPLCICFRGFTGKNCESAINDCGNSVCSVNNSNNSISIKQEGYKIEANTGQYTNSNRPSFRNFTTTLPTTTGVTKKQTHRIVPDTLTTIRQQVYTAYLVSDPEKMSTVPTNQQIKFSIRYPSRSTAENVTSKPNQTNGRLFSYSVSPFMFATESSGSRSTIGNVEAKTKIKTSPAINHVTTKLMYSNVIDRTTATQTFAPLGLTTTISRLKTPDISHNVEYNRFHLQSVTTTHTYIDLKEGKTDHAYLPSKTETPNKHGLKTHLPNYTTSSRHESKTEFPKSTVSTILWSKIDSLNSTGSSKYRLETAPTSIANSSTNFLNISSHESSNPTKDPSPTISLMTSPSIKHGFISVSALASTPIRHEYQLATSISQVRLNNTISSAPKLMSSGQIETSLSPKGAMLPSSTSISGHSAVQIIQQSLSTKKGNMINLISNGHNSGNKHYASTKSTNKPAASLKNRKTTISEGLISAVTYFTSPTERVHKRTTLNDKHSTIKNIKNPFTQKHRKGNKATSQALLGSFTTATDKFTKATSSPNQQRHLFYDSTTKSDLLVLYTVVTEYGKTTNHSKVQVDNTSEVTTKGETVSDVITVESMIIGALLMALILVVAVAVFKLYQRHRSGTVYISSPHHSGSRTDTSVKDLFPERTKQLDNRPREELQPRCVSSKLYDSQIDARSPVYNIPKRKVTTRVSSNSSTCPSTSPASSRSGNYDDVESPDLTFPAKIRRLMPRNRILGEEKSVLNIGRGNGVVSPDSSPNDSRRTDECGKRLSDKEHQENRLLSTNPFYRRDDGTINLSLSPKYKSRTQEEFESLLEEILNEEENHHLQHPGRRRSIFSISGTNVDKSEA